MSNNSNAALSNPIQTHLLNYMTSLENHPIYQNQYFSALKLQGWDRENYDRHRANFFYRTELTVKGIASICASAAANDDQPTLVLFSHILDEETGSGDITMCHELLMEQAHNLYGEVEFGLPPLLVKEAKDSDLLTDGTKQYRDKIIELTSGNYNRTLGLAMALESHADHMLSAFREVFRLSREKMKIYDYKKNVELYFNCHLDNGVEERHAEDAKACVLGNCHTEQDLDEIMEGAEGMLKIQQIMWDDMFQHLSVQPA